MKEETAGFVDGTYLGCEGERERVKDGSKEFVPLTPLDRCGAEVQGRLLDMLSVLCSAGI